MSRAAPPLAPAPLFADVADGPGDGRAVWLAAEDGVRLRAGLWAAGAPRGTVLLFPGRTEYVEKYGRTARDLAARGLATLVIDWRGQGLSDRLTEDAMAGHIARFTDYQHDVRALVSAAGQLGLPRPWYLLAHSMGGAIGLRAAIEGLPVAACVFSAPMWGIRLSRLQRPLAWGVSWAGRRAGMGHRYAPGTTGGQSYVTAAPFESNLLTGDRKMYDYMIAQLTAHPELALGGPSLHWLNEALRETRALARMPSPALPCLTLLGTREEIVDPDRIRARIRAWPGAELEIVEGGRHEVLLEDERTRARLADRMAHFCEQAAPAERRQSRQAPGALRDAPDRGGEDAPRARRR